MLPNANGAVVTFFAVMSAGRVPAMINFTAGAANILRRLPRRRHRHHPDVARLRREGPARTSSSQQLADARCASSISRTSAQTVGIARQAARRCCDWKKPLVARKPDDWAAILFTSGSEGHAQGRRAVPPQHAGQCGAGRGAHRFRPRGQGVQRAAGVPFVRADGGHRCCRWSPACRSIFIRRRCITAPCRSWSTASAPPSCSAPTRSSTAMRASAQSYDFRSLRYVLAGAEPVKEIDAPASIWRSSACAFSKATASPRRSPVLALNTPMFNKFGTVGRLLPGMEARLEKVEGVEEGGRLFVQGPERDARLSARRQSRRARAAAGRLARHRRHRHHRRRRALSRSRAAPSASPRSAAR